MIIRELRTKSEPPPISVISWKSRLIWIVPIAFRVIVHRFRNVVQDVEVEDPGMIVDYPLLDQAHHEWRAH